MKAVRCDDYMREATGVAKTLGRNMKARVVFKKDEVTTDGDTITVPALPVNGTLSAQEVAFHRGFIDHEDAHLRHTEIDLMGEIVERYGPESLTRLLTNTFEDHRIERLSVREYPGTLKNLEAMASVVVKELDAKIEGVMDDGPMTTALAVEVLGRQNLGMTIDGADSLLSKMPTDALARANDWLKKIAEADSTRRILEIAESIAAEPPRETEPDGGSCGDEGDGEKAGKRADKTTSGESGEDGDGEAQHGGDKDDGEDEDDGPREAVMPKVSPPAKGFDAAKHDMLWKLGDVEADDGAPYVVYTTEHDRVVRATDKDLSSEVASRLSRGSLDDWKRFQKTVSGKVGVMGRRLERVLQSTMKRGWAGGKDWGRLDTRRLVRAVNGDPNVFRQREDSPEIDTAMLILIDLSGSMGHGKIALAEQVAVLSLLAVDRIGCATQVSGWCNEIDTEDEMKMHELATAARATRTEPLQVLVFKDWSESINRARKTLMAIKHASGGNNTDGEAVAWAASELRRRPEKRKILLVLSDGFPAAHVADGGSYQRLYEHLKTQVRKAEKSGVETFGIGIMSDAVEQFYPKHVVCRDLNEFAAKSFDSVASLFLGRKVHLHDSA